MIPYGRQSLDDSDVEAVVRVLKSDFLTCGPEVAAFEQEFADEIGAKHAIAVCNGTAALHLAMRVAGVGPGDRVITSPNTFLASANAAAYVGATPDFADIDPDSYNLSPQALEAAWQPDTKAVVAVDYAGQPANMPAIASVARNRGGVVIEDACHGIGGGFDSGGQRWKIGNHPWADITTFSFHPVKSLTTGEGGMLVTNDDGYARNARQLRTHGMERDPARFKVFEPAPWVYEMQSLGYNYRITDLQCALGRSQLKKLAGFIQRRCEIVETYNSELADLEWLKVPIVAESAAKLNFCLRRAGISWHLYTVQIDFDAIGRRRIDVMEQLRSHGIGTQVLYIPVYLQPWYRETYGYEVGKCPVAEAYYQRTLSLPLYPAMSDHEVRLVLDHVKRIGDG